MHPLLDRYRATRAFTERLCEPLAAEDYQVQSMADCSPAKWHLAHTTWFFETFVLSRLDGYRPYDVSGAFEYLFNSYYNQVGPQFPRPDRGLLTRPTVAEVYNYRRYVDDCLLRLVEDAPDPVAVIITLGINHEQQHQELLVTDLKYTWSLIPAGLRPVYCERRPVPAGILPLDWIDYPEQIRCIGHHGEDFAFDNETPAHRALIQPFQLAGRAITNGEYLDFIDDGGYQRPELWLSDGWYAVHQNRWQAPLYWEQRDGGWSMMTLGGERAVEPAEPVCHVSYFEADAYARWAGARLPTESEWETAAALLPLAGNFVEDGCFHPLPARAERPAQMFGDVWEWTSSPYTAYPGFRPPAGALGEYNAKFMNGQYVLRGGSCFTPRSHIRATYRNFFAPDKRWQATGIRLARDAMR